ncbi:hypothetical protein AWB92_02050 [Mycobacterium sp. IEC1808]|nr:hypothetical protein AWB92_02050 [Mycobacterium sp. IEC1808]
MVIRGVSLGFVRSAKLKRKIYLIDRLCATEPVDIAFLDISDVSDKHHHVSVNLIEEPGIVVVKHFGPITYGLWESV